MIIARLFLKQGFLISSSEKEEYVRTIRNRLVSRRRSDDTNKDEKK